MANTTGFDKVGYMKGLLFFSFPGNENLESKDICIIIDNNEFPSFMWTIEGIA